MPSTDLDPEKHLGFFMTGIYKITSPSGKIYIGQSVNINKRLYSYKSSGCKSQTKLYYSFQKYNFENHIFEIIEECDISELNARERYWQDFYEVIGKNGLNCRLQSCNNKSGKISKESILKISLNRAGITPIFKNPEIRIQKIRMSLTGKKLSGAHRMSMSIAQTGLKRSPEAIKKSAESRRGLKFGDDFKQKMSIIQSGGKNSFAKITLNTETGIYYETAKEAAESIGWTYNRLNNYMNGRTKKKISFIYV